jgi:DNA-binding SARP family transcriptional activator
MIRGELFADLRYESWAAPLQLSVQNDVRSKLLPIATHIDGSFDSQVSIDAATALVNLDPFDEAATVALADGLARSGRQKAAKDLLVRYSEQIREELEGDIPPALLAAQTRIGVRSS